MTWQQCVYWSIFTVSVFRLIGYLFYILYQPNEGDPPKRQEDGQWYSKVHPAFTEGFVCGAGSGDVKVLTEDEAWKKSRAKRALDADDEIARGPG